MMRRRRVRLLSFQSFGLEGTVPDSLGLWKSHFVVRGRQFYYSFWAPLLLSTKVYAAVLGPGTPPLKIDTNFR